MRPPRWRAVSEPRGGSQRPVHIAKVTFPYLVIMVLFTLLLTVYPQIMLWLPGALAR
jgi:TRAP-type C4-dicarboxylate transport system permease large subunit